MVEINEDYENLGQKHRNYNKLLQEFIAENKPVSEIRLDDTLDIQNLLKIDVACHYKDVDYVIQILKSDDMLYVSRALSKSLWLVTDPQYAHIINPEYVNSKLLPLMTTKAYIKLIKYIRNNIKDETRAELFYANEKMPCDAAKWLPSCSIPFIESNITKHIDHIQVTLFKRICTKSITIFEIFYKHSQNYDKEKYARAVNFFLSTDTDKYLDIIEQNQYQAYIKFNAKATEKIMKHCPERVINNFEKYYNYIDIQTFTKFLNAEEVKSFLYAQAKKDFSRSDVHEYLRSLLCINQLKYFIKRLPKDEQFDFVKQLFIEDAIANQVEESGMTEREINMKKLSYAFHTVCSTHTYVWYEFAPFEVAFEAITALISMDLKERGTTFLRLSTLITCASHRLENIQTLLKYYIDRNQTRASKYKLDFVIKLLKRTKIYKYDEKTWCLLNELFNIMKIYEDSSFADNKRADICFQSILIYHVLNDQNVPDVIEKQFSFQTLKAYKNKLNKEQRDKLFRYLYEHLLRMLKNPIINEEDFTQSIETLSNIGALLKDWNKNILDYPLVLDKLKELITLKKENSWKQDLSSLYKNNKSWRKHVFEESLTLYPHEEACLNALKHDPQLLHRCDKEVAALRVDGSASVKRLLAKIQIYWPNTFSKDWIYIYLQQLDGSSGPQKAAVRGLCITLHQKALLEMIEKYKPEKSKVDWNEVDDRVFSMQQLLAKNMHLARPQPPPNMILWYAKGDYLKFALPSLLAIFYNITLNQCQQYIPALLDAPVSVQKHGLRFAFQRLDQDIVKNVFVNSWKNTKNPSIKVITFTFIFKLLSNEKDNEKAIGLWEILEMFLNNLTFEEDKKIYKLLSKVEEVPLVVRSNFLIKSYKFLQNLIPNAKEAVRQDYEWQRNELMRYSRDLMETISQDFIIELIQEFMNKDSNDIIAVISAYLLCAKDENIQKEKYDKVFVPLMREFQTKWEEKNVSFTELLMRLSIDLKEYSVEKDMIIPLNMFVSIQNELENFEITSKNYNILTRWKLIVAITKLIKEFCANDKCWDDICNKIAAEFGKTCLDYLKEDVTKYFSCVYVLFAKIVERILDDLSCSDSTRLKVYNELISEKKFIQGFLAAIEINNHNATYKDETYKPLWQELSSHPFAEVKMHFYNRIGRKVLEK